MGFPHQPETSETPTLRVQHKLVRLRLLRTLLCGGSVEVDEEQGDMMERRVPYRIYDPGGSGALLTKDVSNEAGSNSVSYQQLVEENHVLKERMKGLKSLGNLLEESQAEASKLRQKVEELVRQDVLKSASLSSREMNSPALIFDGQDCLPASAHQPQCDLDKTGKLEPEAKAEAKPSSSGSSSEFEVVSADDKKETKEECAEVLQKLATEDGNVSVHLQRLENSLSLFAEETNGKELLAHLGRMAVDFNRLSSKVQKNEYKTTILQTLCEQLQSENEDLRKKLDHDINLKNQMMEKMKYENMKLKRMVAERTEQKHRDQQAPALEVVSKHELPVKLLEGAGLQQSAKTTEQQESSEKNIIETLEKKVTALELQRKELLEVNKQWDQQFRSMKQQYEQKIVTLRQRLATAQKELSERENGCEEKQKDFDKMLLLAKSKIENGESEKERCLTEIKELKQRNQCLQNQILPLTKQREYQEKEIQRLNKALEEALTVQPSTPHPPLFSNTGESCMNARRTELLTQIDVLKQQVKIFEEDFQRERSDRERMNEEKEELKQKLEKVQSEITLLNTQLGIYQEDYQKEKLEKEKIQRLLKHQKQVSSERRSSDPPPGAHGPYCPPPYQLQYPPLAHPGNVYGGYDWQIHYPPAGPNAPHAHYRPSEHPWNAPYQPTRSPHAAEPHWPTADGKESTSPRLGKGQH
ncbi:TNFAIP3-interacting protein 1 isoform X2 [Carcharodon carcharias]|uniref:TNFAIP3-interacting protein 1 isoform X2 n=1 Tax=Carcharodon carcharias TaxID=13397 RepID=UPI001B7DD5E8|nr:TNFAIP3-interacting protein 1 isoform X2 [Carcharodon carcharias]